MLLRSKAAGKTPDPDVYAYLIALVKPQLDTLETLLAKKGPFLTGEHFTVADIQIYYATTFENLWDRNFDAYPHTKAWIQKMYEVKEIKEISDKFNAFTEEFKKSLKESA